MDCPESARGVSNSRARGRWAERGLCASLEKRGGALDARMGGRDSDLQGRPLAA